jgi:hypothetical protein
MVALVTTFELMDLLPSRRPAATSYALVDAAASLERDRVDATPESAV